MRKVPSGSTRADPEPGPEMRMAPTWLGKCKECGTLVIAGTGMAVKGRSAHNLLTLKSERLRNACKPVNTEAVVTLPVQVLPKPQRLESL